MRPLLLLIFKDHALKAQWEQKSDWGRNSPQHRNWRISSNAISDGLSVVISLFFFESLLLEWGSLECGHVSLLLSRGTYSGSTTSVPRFFLPFLCYNLVNYYSSLWHVYVGLYYGSHTFPEHQDPKHRPIVGPGCHWPLVGSVCEFVMRTMNTRKPIGVKATIMGGSLPTGG